MIPKVLLNTRMIWIIKRHKISIGFDDMIADILSNKKTLFNSNCVVC